MIDFNKYANTETALKKCLEYAENPEIFTTVYNSTKITFFDTGIKTYFPEDKEKRQTLKVNIKRNNKTISFSFGMSIHDTEILHYSGSRTRSKHNYTLNKIINCYDIAHSKGKQEHDKEINKILKNLPYSIYACIGSEYFCPDTFEDFCSEYGYNDDSIKALELFKKCLKQANNLKTIFTEEEIESFPR